MQIQVYHCDDFINSDSEIYQLQGEPMEIYQDKETTLSQLYEDGWKLIKIIHHKKEKYTFFLEKD